MKVGQKIKKLRELKNLTQAHVAEQLNLSLSGYGKIERDETDITLSRLEEIASILGTDYNTILSFDEKHIFNFQQNNNANGIVQNQQVTDKGAWQQLVDYLKEENSVLKNKLEKFSK
ncbi:MAG: helix-turn-helix transcriptional regulator [Vicingaceae bacterium]|nr:helix-turn-helix transcriptional regulator [Vicingaceae bacterium]